jgi:thiol-disulfide isomerase/thioredoxin
MVAGDASCVRVPVIVPRRLRFAAIGLLVALPAVALGARALFRRAEPAPARAVATQGTLGEACGDHGACKKAIAAKPGDLPPVDVPTGKPRLLEFSSQHCPACERMKPVVVGATARCATQNDTVLQVDVDEPNGEALAERYRVSMLPTFLTVDAEGTEVERIVGVQPEERIALAIGDVEGRVCPRM